MRPLEHLLLGKPHSSERYGAVSPALGCDPELPSTTTFTHPKNYHQRRHTIVQKKRSF
jgi:hypothetical protein